MKPTKNKIELYLGIYSSLEKKLEYLRSEKRRLKRDIERNPLKDGLSPKDETLIDIIEAKITRYSKELQRGETDKIGKKDYRAGSSFLTKDHIYRRFDELKEDMSVKEAHQEIQELLKVYGLEPEDHHVNINPNSFNRKVNQYISRKKRNQNS